MRVSSPLSLLFVITSLVASSAPALALDHCRVSLDGGHAYRDDIRLTLQEFVEPSPDKPAVGGGFQSGWAEVYLGDRQVGAVRFAVAERTMKGNSYVETGGGQLASFTMPDPERAGATVVATLVYQQMSLDLDGGGHARGMLTFKRGAKAIKRPYGVILFNAACLTAGEG